MREREKKKIEIDLLGYIKWEGEKEGLRKR